MSQQLQGYEAEEAYQGATQACGSSSDEDELAVSELRQINQGVEGRVCSSCLTASTSRCSRSAGMSRLLRVVMARVLSRSCCPTLGQLGRR